MTSSGPGLRPGRAPKDGPSMANGGDGYTIDPAGPGAPVLLAFDDRSAPGASPHADLLARLARRGGRPFGSILLHDRARAGFYRGVPGLGDTIDEVAAALRPLIAALEP